MTLKPRAFEQYYLEPQKIGLQGLHAILEKGRAWDLSKTLASGGSAIFPHTYLKECGYQIAAVVHGCLDSGADHVVVLGVLHSFTKELKIALNKEKNYQDLSHERYRGIFWPDQGNEFLEKEYSLFFFTLLWEEEIKRRGIKAPRLTIRYPFLANRTPALLPGMHDLEALAKNAVVVATADLCHHGLAYGSPQVKEIDQSALQFARDTIDRGFKILESGDYDAYYLHCVQSISDSINTGTVLRHLRGPQSACILDMKLVNVASLFKGDPSPSWVAASLIELQQQR